MELPEIFNKYGKMVFLLTSVIVMVTFYIMYNNKSIKINDDKANKSILPLWIFTIIMITFLLTAASESYQEKYQWGACLSSLITLGLCIWVPISLK